MPPPTAPSPAIAARGYAAGNRAPHLMAPRGHIVRGHAVPDCAVLGYAAGNRAPHLMAPRGHIARGHTVPAHTI